MVRLHQRLRSDVNKINIYKYIKDINIYSKKFRKSVINELIPCHVCHLFFKKFVNWCISFLCPLHII